MTEVKTWGTRRSPWRPCRWGLPLPGPRGRGAEQVPAHSSLALCPTGRPQRTAVSAQGTSSTSHPSGCYQKSQTVTRVGEDVGTLGPCAQLVGVKWCSFPFRGWTVKLIIQAKNPAQKPRLAYYWDKGPSRSRSQKETSFLSLSFLMISAELS